MIDWPEFWDFPTRQAFWTILVGICGNACCALLGCFLVLRRMSMLGDALAHAVLPGLVLGFILSGSTAAVPMFLGAAVFAMLTAGLSRLLTSLGHASEEAGLGIVFTAFFALGILLIQVFAENVHLDRDAVLEGAIEYVTLDTVTFAGREWPSSLGVTGLVLLGVILWLGLFWKEVQAATFDPEYASAIGLGGSTMLALLMLLVAVCVVASFKVVGSVLVVAMLVVPGASAQLICQNLRNMLLVSVLFASATTIAGYLLAREFNTSASGMMAVVAGIGYLLALLLAPGQGLLASRWQRRWLRQRIEEEDLLGLLFRAGGNASATEAIERKIVPWDHPELKQWIGARTRARVVRQLESRGLVLRLEQGLQLTETGQARGRQVVRGHRLWETFLDEEFSLPADHLHAAAHRMEHYLDPESQQSLAEQLGSPTTDPHGQEIPREN